MLQITKKIISGNQCDTNNVQYIVIHDTGNQDKGANAEAHYKYFNGGNRGASAHYFVDDHSIIQIIEDSHGSWHCGDGGGAYGIHNRNSIGIETCINSDGDYATAVSNTVDLAAYLLKKYNLGIDRLVRHYDASRKNCPMQMNKNGQWTDWYVFKNRVAAMLDPSAKPIVAPVIKPSTSPSTDNDILYAQRTINRLKIASLVEDGIDGPNTQAAVRKFQSIVGIGADGIVGFITFGAMKEIMAKPLLKQGSTGIAVRYLQFRVASNTDGIFGPGTASSVKQFQYVNGLGSDGVVGPMTWAKLIG